MEQIRILFSEHAMLRIRERLGSAYEFEHNGFVRLIRTHDASKRRHSRDGCLPTAGGYLVGCIVQNRGGKTFLVKTALSGNQFRRSQSDGGFTPVVVRLFGVGVVEWERSDLGVSPVQQAGQDRIIGSDDDGLATTAGAAEDDPFR